VNVNILFILKSLYSQFPILNRAHVAGSCYKWQFWSTQYAPDRRHDHLWHF